MAVLAHNLKYMLRQFYVWGEEVKQSIGQLIKRLVKVGPRVLIRPGGVGAGGPGFSPGAPPSGDGLETISSITI